MMQGPRKIAVLIPLVAVMCAWALGAPLLNSGDVDTNGAINVADVIGLENLLAGGGMLSGLEFALADANQDGAHDATDTSFLVDVVLQREAPLPLIQQSPITAVSFWRKEAASPLEQVDNPFIAPVSFWKPSQPSDTFDASQTVFQAVSVWRLDLEITDQNVIQLGTPSFDRH